MSAVDKDRKPRIGLFLIGCDRFVGLGAGTSGGLYEGRIGEQARGLIAALAPHAQLHNGDRIVFGRPQVQPSILSFVENQVDMVLVVFLSWSQDAAWVRLLRDLPPLPMLLYCPARENVGFDAHADDEQFVEFLASGGLVGALEASGSIRRQGRPVRVVAGTVEQALPRLLAFAAAARTAALAREARFGLLAGSNPLMWSTWVDPYRYFTEVGPEIHTVSYGTLAAAVSRVSDNEAAAYRAQLASRCPREPGVDDRLFLESARASLGLAAVARELDLDAIALNDVDRELLDLIGLRPGFYPQSLNDQGRVVVAEADLGAAFAVFALRLLTGGPVNFVEPFYADAAANRFAAGHAGPNDHSAPGARVRIAPDVRFRNLPIRFPGAPFAWQRFAPGLKTFAHFSECSGSYKIVCFRARCIDGPHLFPSFAHGEFETDGPVPELFETVLRCGTNQHFAVADADACFALEALAEIKGFAFHKAG